MSTSLSSLLHLQGLPPLPRSLSGYERNPSGLPSNHSSQNQSSKSQAYSVHGSPQNYSSSSQQQKSSIIHSQGQSRTGPVPPPRPHSRRSSSSGSSFRASPEHATTNSSSNRGIIAATEGMRSSPRSQSSSPHSPHMDSGFGRSSADSFSEPPRAFVRVVQSPTSGNRLDAQLSQLRRDMQHLRQQDMSLLGHLLQINQGIQDLKNVLVPPPQPAPSMPMFHSTPIGYSSMAFSGGNLYANNPPPPAPTRSSNPRKIHISPVSRGAKLFARRSSTEKMLIEGDLVTLGSLGAVGGFREKEEDSESISSLEFGDV